MVKCTFCGTETSPIHGVHVIHNDGMVSFFCSSKCRKNALKLKRDKRRLKWTLAYREEREKLAQREKDMKHKTAVKVHEAKTVEKKSEHGTNNEHHASGAEHHEKKEHVAVHDKKRK